VAILHYHVDWNNSGQFDHACSDITAYVLPASFRFGRSAAHEYDSAGVASLTLDNSSSIFSSFNSLSPLYGKILPNIRVRITMTVGGATTTMFQGFLESITPTVGVRVAVSTAELVAYGVLSQFNEGEVSVPLQENIDTGSALSALLDHDGYSATERLIDAGLTTISKWWVRPGSQRLQAIRELQSAEFGRIREGKNGHLCFENRAHIFTAPHDAPQATYGTGSLRIWNLRQENPLLGVFNKVSSRIHTFNVSEDIILVVLADVPNNQGGTPPVVPGNGTLEIDIDYPTASSLGNYIAVDSWSTVDYEANTLADRTGADITADVSAVKTYLGSRQTIVFTNHNSSSAHLVVLRAHGIAIVEGDPIPVNSEDAGSQAKYRKREYPYPSEWLTYLPDGKTYCDYIVSVFKDPRPRLVFDVKGDYDTNHLNEVRQRDIGDRIRVVASLADFGLAIDAEFIIDSLAYSVDTAGLITMTVTCTQAPAAQLGPLATPYAPKTIPEPDVGGEPHVPDDYWTNAIVNGMNCLVGCMWRKWNADIDQAQLRAICLQAKPVTVDLRTPAEGGSFEHNGIDKLILTGLGANYGGRNYTLRGAKEGRWYFAWRAHNGAGWSVWSDGNDVPQYVTDFAEIEDIARMDTGPPADWTVSPPEAGPTPNTVVVSATRPKENGNVILFVFFQIKSVASPDTGWNEFDEEIGSEEGEIHVAFDGSGSASRYNPETGVIEHTGGFADAQEGDLILFDVRGVGAGTGGREPFGRTFGKIQTHQYRQATDLKNGSSILQESLHGSNWAAYADCFQSMQQASSGSAEWDLHHCLWGTVPAISGDQITGMFGLRGVEPPAADGWYSDVRIKIVHGPWSWRSHGYFGVLPAGGWCPHPDYGEPWMVKGGDKDTQVFKSLPMPIPGDVDISNIQARVVFGNTYSFSDDGRHSDSGSGESESGGPIPVADTPVLSIDADQGCVFSITLTRDCTLELSGGADGQPVLVIVTQDAAGGHQLSMGAMVNIGEIDYGISLAANKTSYLGFICRSPSGEYNLAPVMKGY
jgi:hypothetical protein